MEMMYHIELGTPRLDMGGAGFSILLFPGWKDAIARAEIDQENVNCVIERLGRGWLDGCGYSKRYGDGYLYEPRVIRISWGEWGPEHITVPGNACGLDIDEGICAPRGGKILGPHNVDSISQAHLLLVVFLWFASTIVLKERAREMGI